MLATDARLPPRFRLPESIRVHRATEAPGASVSSTFCRRSCTDRRRRLLSPARHHRWFRARSHPLRPSAPQDAPERVPFEDASRRYLLLDGRSERLRVSAPVGAQSGGRRGPGAGLVSNGESCSFGWGCGAQRLVFGTPAAGGSVRTARHGPLVPEGDWLIGLDVASMSGDAPPCSYPRARQRPVVGGSWPVMELGVRADEHFHGSATT